MPLSSPRWLALCAAVICSTAAAPAADDPVKVRFYLEGAY